MDHVWGLLDQYGLWALAIGAFFQGYTLVIVAGLLASQNHMNAMEVWLISAISAWIGHWFFFGLGRWLKRHRHVLTNTRFNQRLDSLNNTIDIHPWFSMFFIQYGYGVRIMGAIAFGLTRMRKLWFAWAQSLNCILWATILSAMGYAVGIGMFSMPNRQIQSLGIGLTALVLVAVFMTRRRRMVTRPVYISKKTRPPHKESHL